MVVGFRAGTGGFGSSSRPSIRSDAPAVVLPSLAVAEAALLAVIFSNTQLYLLTLLAVSLVVSCCIRAGRPSLRGMVFVVVQ